MLVVQVERYLSPTTLKMIKDYYDFLGAKNRGLSQREANQKCSKPPHLI
jgi:hypothetical protein